jgi:hypothetical protein
VSGPCADGNSGRAGQYGRGAGVIHSGACSGVIVDISQVRITMVGIRAPPGMGISVVHVMGAECK